ncbi:hypothetical protein BZG36_02921 [Bifiguratus adelaidae]|uniref:IMP-specific 5'-nucleotidase 1 n=1 Tax=Bifiguratus adelaidae TaxID=1938954 RepID=A0A261Y1G1_9FUNG|nr:hypothetical protein BZG36_02921 [Bifiguratus adelaidae]
MTSTYRINYQLKSHKRDALIEFIKTCLQTSFVLYDESDYDDRDADLKQQRAARKEQKIQLNLRRYTEVMESVEALIQDHIACHQKGIPEHSRLFRLVPTVSTFFTPLPLKDAFLKANAQNSIAARKYVPPSFNDIRRILNTAQVQAIADTLQLITFDGDMTLYADGQDFEHDSELVQLLVHLLQCDLYVCVVTAAGYGNDAVRYEGRLSGLLRGFTAHNVPEHQLKRFYVLGGECNFLFQCRKDGHLHYIPEDEYQPDSIRAWSQDMSRISRLLDIAQSNLEDCVRNMGLHASVIRKPKADECVLSTQFRLLQYQRSPSVLAAPLPFCAFNGGSDVWVDIGNKLIGVQILQDYLGADPARTLHVGDQFLSTGNDYATRASCCTLWIISPAETQQVLKELNQLLRRSCDHDIDGTIDAIVNKSG